MASHATALRHHFENEEQQKEASSLGMWVFLLTEIMFFGGMFMAYLAYRQILSGIVRGRQFQAEYPAGRGQHGRADLQLADDGDGGAFGGPRRSRN